MSNYQGQILLIVKLPLMLMPRKLLNAIMQQQLSSSDDGQVLWYHKVKLRHNGFKSTLKEGRYACCTFSLFVSDIPAHICEVHKLSLNSWFWAQFQIIMQNRHITKMLFSILKPLQRSTNVYFIQTIAAGRTDISKHSRYCCLIHTNWCYSIWT